MRNCGKGQRHMKTQQWHELHVGSRTAGAGPLPLGPPPAALSQAKLMVWATTQDGKLQATDLREQKGTMSSGNAILNSAGSGNEVPSIE